jgi:membrane-bound lytic murein transglycosylase B
LTYASRSPRTIRPTVAFVALLIACSSLPGIGSAQQAETSPRSASKTDPKADPKAAPKATSKTAPQTAPKGAPKPASNAAASGPARAKAGGPAAGAFAERAEVRDFIRQMVDRHGFDERSLAAIFADVRREPLVLKLIAPPPPDFKRSWEAYRARFLDPLRIRGGVAFWNEHADALGRAAQVYGVPAEVIVAIIGVETIYGRVTGEFRVVDALATLAFDYPRRAPYFREELEQFLLLSRETGADVFAARGSFAGAIGLPQFMPGSIRRYAIDFDGDGRIDLRSNPADAIGSVARFLAEHGWVPGGPVYYPTRIDDGARLAPLIDAGIEPQFSSEQLSGFGVSAMGDVPDGTSLALIDLPNGDAEPTYLLGARNFYVITRYNRSSFYAMAVLELADALRSAR